MSLLWSHLAGRLVPVNLFEVIIRQFSYIYINKILL